MYGTGLPEIVIILLVVVLLFGPAVLTFWLGYVMGRTRSTDGAEFRAEGGTKSDAGSEEGSDE